MTWPRRWGLSRGLGWRAERLALAGAVLVGALVRLSFVVGHDFPLNDGGLFYLMTRELQQARYALPLHTAYNGADIPFAYPPLGLYLAGLLDELGPWSLLEVYRFLPFVLSLLTIPAFYLLARALVAGPALAYAVVAFALLPRSFCWLIMGGGVTRALGFVFALVAVWQGYLMYTRAARGHLVAAMLCASGAVLSHLEMGLFVAYTLGVFLLVYGRGRAGLWRSALVALGTAALTAPWWGAVIARHGLAPLLAASDHGWGLLSGVATLLLLLISEEPHFPLLALLALLGALACLARGRRLEPVWLAVAFVLDPRSAHTVATVPLALLAGIGISEWLLPLLSRAPRPTMEASGEVSGEGGGAKGLLGQGVLAFIFLYALLSALAPGRPLLEPLSPEERQAMAWVAGHTPPESRFLVLTGDHWPEDRSAEWFPVLAGRVSVATVQATEWLPGFERRARGYVTLQRCARQDVACLERWAQQAGVAFSHVYVARRPAVARGASGDCCSGLLSALFCDRGYRLLYDGPGAAVFGRAAAPARGAGVGGGDGGG